MGSKKLCSLIYYCHPPSHSGIGNIRRFDIEHWQPFCFSSLKSLVTNVSDVGSGPECLQVKGHFPIVFSCFWLQYTAGKTATPAPGPSLLLAAKVANLSMPPSLPMQTGPEDPSSHGQPGSAGDEAFAAGYLTDESGIVRRGVARFGRQEQGVSSCISLRMSGWVDAMQKILFFCSASKMGEGEEAAFERVFPCSRAEHSLHSWM